MSRTSIVGAAFAAVLLASPVAAQSVIDAPTTRFTAPTAQAAPVTELALPAVAPSLASTQSAAPVGVHAITTTLPFAPAPAPRAYGRSPALMIVGGAMLLVGAVIGGDSGTIVMLGGGGLGLLGLWTYLR
ncbi:MAG: hypothetical protein ACYC7F_00335 [Gemmatimonadaceae bacterium]